MNREDLYHPSPDCTPISELAHFRQLSCGRHGWSNRHVEHARVGTGRETFETQIQNAIPRHRDGRKEIRMARWASPPGRSEHARSGPDIERLAVDADSPEQASRADAPAGYAFFAVWPRRAVSSLPKHFARCGNEQLLAAMNRESCLAPRRRWSHRHGCYGRGRVWLEPRRERLGAV